MSTAGGLLMMAYFGPMAFLPFSAPLFFYFAWRVRNRSERDYAALLILGIMMSLQLVSKLMSVTISPFGLSILVPSVFGIGVVSFIWAFFSRLGWRWRIGYAVFGLLAFGLPGLFQIYSATHEF